MFLIISHFNHLKKLLAENFPSVASEFYDDKKLWGSARLFVPTIERNGKSGSREKFDLEFSILLGRFESGGAG